MTKVPYSLRSFKLLAERESRRGRDISRAVPAVKKAVDNLRDRREAYQLEISSLNIASPARLAARETYREERNELRRYRDEALEDALLGALSMFETALQEEAFSLGLATAVKIDDRQTYRISDALDVAFPMKQATAVVRDLISAPSPSRNSIIRALKEALRRKYQHAVYRLDIKKFFESIPHDKLLERLNTQQRLDKVTEFLIYRLLREYSQITGKSIGVPQGVGLSSQLAEFYMRAFDRHIKSAPGVLFYARYVDDIVVVLEDKTALTMLKNETDIVLKELGLEANFDKTKELLTGKKGDYPTNESLEYLGYRFIRSNDSLVTGLTKNRQHRRVSRLEATLKAWLDTAPVQHDPNYGHDGMLIDRIRYLTGNTKLLNSKDNVAIGLYFSNSALDENAQELTELDNVLQQFLDDHSGKMCDRLYDKLGQFSFVTMFRDRVFYRFSQRRVQRIIQCWQAGVA